MGGTKKFSKFIVEWERVAGNTCANRAGNVHSCISVADKVFKFRREGG